VRTNLFVPSHFCTTCTNFDICCQRYIAMRKSFFYRCTSSFSALTYCGGIFFKPLSYVYELVRTIFSASKTFWKIYFLYDFWSAQTCSYRAVFGLPIRNLTIAVKHYIATCGKIYIGAHPHSRPKLLRWIFFPNRSAMYMKWCVHTFPPTFGLFAFFRTQFGKYCGTI